MRRCAVRLGERAVAYSSGVAGPSRLAYPAARPSPSAAATRCLSTTAPSAYPRQVVRRTERRLERPIAQQIEPDEDADADAYRWGDYDSVAPPKAASNAARHGATPDGSKSRLTFGKSSSRSTEDVPWYLRKSGTEGSDAVAQTAEDVLGTGEEEIEAPPPAPVDISVLYPDLPEQLVGLHGLLTEGGPSALVTRADDVGEDGMPIDAASGRPPIHYIHARKHDEQAWTEWLAVVQVRSSAGGSVSRVAKDVGAFLRHIKPPVPLYGDPEAISTSADDFLGPMEDALGRPSRGEAEVGEEEEVFEASQKRAWKPIKIMSREAQDGMRMLHQNDPERWTRKELAQTFQLSVESVRRILKSNWQPSSSVVNRQNRRAREREEQRRMDFLAGKEGSSDTADPSTMSWASREAKEIEKIKRSINTANLGRRGSEEEGANLDMQEQQENSEESDIDALMQQAEEHGKRSGHLQPIFYEGLVTTPSQGASASQKGRSFGTAKEPSRAKSGILRGDGEWCLVDAGWVVVHVMSARARSTYDVESQYEQMSVPVERFY